MKETKKPEKKWFDVKVEALVPTLLTYRILADNEEDALEQVKRHSPKHSRPNLSLKRLIKATVYASGTLMIKLTRNFR